MLPSIEAPGTVEQAPASFVGRPDPISIMHVVSS